MPRELTSQIRAYTIISLLFLIKKLQFAIDPRGALLGGAGCGVLLRVLKGGELEVVGQLEVGLGIALEWDKVND